MDGQDMLMTREQVCDLLAIRKNLFYKMVREGDLPPGMKRGKRNVWPRSSIADAIRKLRDRAEANVWRRRSEVHSAAQKAP